MEYSASWKFALGLLQEIYFFTQGKHIFCDAVTCSFSSSPRLSLEQDTDYIAFLMLTEDEVSCLWNIFQISWDYDGH